MASRADLVRDWQRGVQAVARGDWGCALRLFSGDPEPPARMCFNVGCVHLLAGDPEAARRAFDQAVTKDSCMAVGFFQRGVANFQLERFQEALSDFRLALAQLRDNAAIDYTQLGLRFKLKAWEVLFNVAAAQCRLGLWAQATRSLEEALSKGSPGAGDDLHAALAQLQKQVPLQPRQVPRGEVFRPHRRHLEHLEPVDFLGKAKVVSSVTPDGQHEDPRPRQPQVRGRLPARLLACHFAGPGTSDLLTATGRECSEPSGAPRRPSRPRVQPVGTHAPPGPLVAGEPDPGPSEDPSGAGGAAVGGPASAATVTVQCAFTVALKVPRGADLAGLRGLLSQALCRQAQHAQLSYRAPSDKGRWVPLPGDEALQRAWRDAAASAGALQLQCRGAGGRAALYQVVAQHNYCARAPEDLALRQGDVVDVLGEVDQAWLEGHHDGHVGIFPKCFVVPAGQYA